MKLSYLLPVLALACLVGCSSKVDDSSLKAAPDATLTADQKAEKIKNDPNVPDGLKQIQIETLQHQPGAKH